MISNSTKKEDVGCWILVISSALTAASIIGVIVSLVFLLVGYGAARDISLPKQWVTGFSISIPVNAIAVMWSLGLFKRKK
jgi:hypothetical protein